jgi:hypothetical protein
VLFVQGGRPAFAVRSDGTLGSVSASARIVGKWAHLAGVLTADRQLQIYLNGKLAASAKAPGLLTGDPSEAMEIGADEGSTVGSYTGPFSFTGLIDEVRILHRGLDAQEISDQAAGVAQADLDATNLKLAFSFDKEQVVDDSGNENHGEATGVVSVQGKVGGALRFTGGASTAADFKVVHHWTSDLPFFPRGMLLAGGNLLVSGPADLLDEEDAFKQIDDPGLRPLLLRQAQAFRGRTGAALWAVSTEDGEKVSELQLEAAPVFDGMAAAGGRLYISDEKGAVVCLSGK